LRKLKIKYRFSISTIIDDLKEDPYEVNNLIRSPEHQQIAEQLREEMWSWLERTDGLNIPLKPIRHKRFDHIYKGTY
ncbi:MAG: hypothetical protein KKG00_14555, partial [Bacteroidetes bacterium]|nr:hypothetical protein [Bacteroidota bacterium]